MDMKLASSHERRENKRIAIYPVSIRITHPFGSCMGFITDFSLSGSNIWTKADLSIAETYSITLVSHSGIHKQDTVVDIRPVWRSQLPSSSCLIYGCQFDKRDELSTKKIDDFIFHLQEDLRYKNDLITLKSVEGLNTPLSA